MKNILLFFVDHFNARFNAHGNFCQNCQIKSWPYRFYDRKQICSNSVLMFIMMDTNLLQKFVATLSKNTSL